VHVLFVCAGNICRSPTAERLTNLYLSRRGVEGVTASSAGVRAVIGHPIHPHAARVLNEYGAQTSDFAARQLSAKISSGADLILTMTAAQTHEVLERAPTKLHRTFSLGEASELAKEFQPASILQLASLRPRLASLNVPDVIDPIGESAEFFEMVGAQIADLLPPVIDLCLR